MRNKTITIIYKSGAKVTLKCKTFTCSFRNGALLEVTWEDPKPRPMFFGVDSVEAIYEGKV